MFWSLFFSLIYIVAHIHTYKCSLCLYKIYCKFIHVFNIKWTVLSMWIWTITWLVLTADILLYFAQIMKSDLDSSKNQEVASLLCDENYVLDILETHWSSEDLRLCSLWHLEFIIIFQFFQLFIHMYFYFKCLIITLTKFPLGNYLCCYAKWFYNFLLLIFIFFNFYDLIVCVNMWTCSFFFPITLLPSLCS